MINVLEVKFTSECCSEVRPKKPKSSYEIKFIVYKTTTTTRVDTVGKLVVICLCLFALKKDIDQLINIFQTCLYPQKPIVFLPPNTFTL